MSSPASEQLVKNKLSQFRVLPNDQIIKASAGTGKTTTLTKVTIEKSLEFLKNHNRLPRIIISTFTKKATEELRERIASDVIGSDNTQLHALVQDAHNLHISTIHGVLSQFLRKYGRYFDIESGFTVSDQDQSRLQVENLLQDFLSKKQNQKKYDKILQSYSFTDIYQAMDKLYEVKSTHPEAIYVSSAKHEEKLQELIGASAQSAHVLISTFVIEDNEKWLDFQSGLLKELRPLVDKKTVDYQQTLAAIKALPTVRHSKKLSFSSDESKELTRRLADLRALLDRAISWQGLLDEYELNNQQMNQMADEFLPRMIQFKKQSGVLDSRDLEIFSLLLLREKSFLGRSFASEWDFWMIDEFQDTSPLQVELIDLLRGEADTFYVGDPQQSIYLFRGARVEVFEEVLEEVLRQNGPQSELILNYRSKKDVLSAMNNLMGFMGDQFTPMQPHHPVNEVDIPALVFKAEAADQDSSQSSTHLPTHLPIVEHIQSLLNKGANYSDIAVLGRTKKDLIRVADVLQKYSIPNDIHVPEGFYSRREITDLLCLAKFLTNPYDDKNLLSLLRSPFFRVQDSDLVKIRQEKSSTWKSLNQLLKDHPSVIALIQMQTVCKELGLFQSLMHFLTDSRFFEVSYYMDPSYRRESNIWKLMGLLREAEKKPGFNYTQFLRRAEAAFKGQQSDDSDAVPASESNRVNLMTVHKSKGLSFPHVILPNMEGELRPSKSRSHESIVFFDEEQQLWSTLVVCSKTKKRMHGPAIMQSLLSFEKREYDELLRLLYVAMTRSKESLCLHAIKSKRAFHKNSWAALFPYWDQEGQQKNEDYQLVVDSGPWEPHASEAISSGKNVDITKPYQVPSQSEKLSRFSVSSLLEDDSSSVSFTPQQSGARRSFLYAPALGTQMHNVFEDLKHFPEDRVLQKIEKQEALYKAIHWSLGVKDPSLKEIIKSGHVEWGFQLKTHLGILEGQIDLWGQINDQVYVFDYKSGSSKYTEKAFQQLEYYSMALAKIYDFKKINMCVLYPLEQKIEMKDFLPENFSSELFPKHT